MSEGLSKKQLKAIRAYELWKRENKMTLKIALEGGLVTGDYAAVLCLGKQLKDEVKQGRRTTSKAKGGRRRH